MEMRVTLQTMINRALVNTRRQTDRLAELQQQASTGLRILNPSDDPLGTVEVMANKAQVGRLDTYVGIIHDARTTLDLGVSALRESSDILTQARRIGIEGSHSGNNATAHEALASEVDALLNRLVDVANTQNAGRYLFSGTATKTVPFVVSATNAQGQPQAVAYRGAAEAATMTVSQQETVATHYVGSEVFQQRQRGPTIYSGSTGAAPGTGLDSATGQGTLQVRHTLTTFAAGSGVQKGTGSDANDTILGSAGTNTLTIVSAGASGTIALNGGAAVPFTNTDTNLLVLGPQGEAVYLDTTAMNVFNGTVAVTADGTLSIDGGASTTPINFASNNQVVTDSVTAAVINVNSTGLRRAGDAHLEYSGSYDAFQILMALRDDLRNTRGLSDNQQVTAIGQRLSDLERVQDGILQTVGQQSASLQNLEGLENRLTDVQIQLRKLTGEKEEVDLSEVVVNLQSQQNLLQLTLAASARVFDQSLLDFLK